MCKTSKKSASNGGRATRVASNSAASDRVANKLRDSIISGEIVSGVPLVETSVAALHGVSRNTVREAVRQLRSEGLVTYTRHRGATVRRLTPVDVRDIYKVRRTLEFGAIKQSSYANDVRYAEIMMAVRSEEDAANDHLWREVGTWSLRFHQYIVGLLESNLLNGFFRTIVAQLRLVFALTKNEQNFQTLWIDKDRDIGEHLVHGRRAEAAAAMQLYLDESEVRVLDIVRSSQPNLTAVHK